jgi:hypothetical protein
VCEIAGSDHRILLCEKYVMLLVSHARREWLLVQLMIDDHRLDAGGATDMVSSGLCQPL